MDDSISRTAAIVIIRSLYPSEPYMKANRERWRERYKHYIEAEEALERLPSAQPERKKGKWIDGQCSICGCDIPAYIIDWKWQKDMDANYCPSCGADMRTEGNDDN